MGNNDDDDGQDPPFAQSPTQDHQTGHHRHHHQQQEQQQHQQTPTSAELPALHSPLHAVPSTSTLPTAAATARPTRPHGGSGSGGGGFAGGPRNIVHLINLRKEGRIPASKGGPVSGGSANSRRESAEARSSGGGGGGNYGFRRSVGGHPSLVGKLRHTSTLRGHGRELVGTG